MHLKIKMDETNSQVALKYLAFMITLRKTMIHFFSLLNFTFCEISRDKYTSKEDPSQIKQCDLNSVLQLFHCKQTSVQHYCLQMK